MAFSSYLSDLLGKQFFLMDAAQPSPLYSKTTHAGLARASSGDESGYYVEISDKAGYARVPTTLDLSIGATDNLCLLIPSVDIQFPEAGENWNDIAMTMIYDHPTKGLGNEIFLIPNYSESYGPEIAPYSILTGQAVHFHSAFPGTRITIRQRTVLGEPEPTWGGVSVEYSIIILQWIMDLAVVPYPRTYDIALGRDLVPELWGRFSGTWTECQGNGYARIPMTTSDWEANGTYGIENISEIVFTSNALSDWGDISDIVLYAHNTTQAAFWGHLSSTTYVSQGDTFSIGPGKINITFTGMQ